jgi:diguanylate cyclase (GGDEF)-like protein
MTGVPVSASSTSESDRPAGATELLRTRSRLIEQFSATGDLAQSLLRGPVTVLDLVPAPAAALHLEGVTSTVGDAPDVARIEQVVEQLRADRRRLPIVSDSLTTEHPQLARLLPGVAGLLIVPVDGARGCLAWFRPELPDATGRSDDSPALEHGTAPSGARGSASDRVQPWEGLADAAVHLSRELDGAILRNLHSDLAQFGFHDALTGLSNRRLLVDRIEQALRGPTRGAGIALLLVDINSFSAVNESFGHDGGDEVLLQAAERLRSVTRDSDTVARVAGDEFVILAGSANRAVAFRIAERVLSALDRPFMVAGRPLTITFSVGLAEAEAEDTPAELMARVHAAMDRAKRSGENQFAY